MKKSLAIALSLSMVGACVCAAHNFKDLTKLMYTDYSEINKQYFLNQLPKDTHIEFEDFLMDDKGNSLMGWTLCIQDHCTIKLDKKQNPNTRVAEFSLIHEMCHVKGRNMPDDNAHGRSFQSCMIDLALQGALHDLW